MADGPKVIGSMMGGGYVVVHLEEGQRQMTLLALAKLSIERPGWLLVIEDLARQMDNDSEGKPLLLHIFRKIHQLPDPERVLMLALDESAALQSHYANLLNMHDG